MKVLMIAVILLSLSGCNMMPRWDSGGGGYQGNNTTADPTGTGNG